VIIVSRVCFNIWAFTISLDDREATIAITKNGIPKAVLMSMGQYEAMCETMEIMESLWDSILYDGEVDTPQWHKNIIEERKKKIKNGNAEFISISKLKSSHR
jgi:hypothetical protein